MINVSLNGAVICDSCSGQKCETAHVRIVSLGSSMSVIVSIDAYICFTEGWGAHIALIYQRVFGERKSRKDFHGWPHALERSKELSPVPAATTARYGDVL